MHDAYIAPCLILLQIFIFQTNDLQQELNSVTNKLEELQTEQKQLQKKQRRSERYFHNKDAQKRSALSSMTYLQTVIAMG